MRKPLTLSAVKYSAMLLIEANGETTTLDVKEMLRALEYQCDQSDVSDLMSQAASELPLEFSNNNGMYRTYTLPTPQAVATPTPTPTPVHQSNVVVYKKRDGTSVIGSTTNITTDIGDWIVTSSTNKGELYLSGTYQRDEVRQSYANHFTVKFGETRARRITD